MSKGSGEGAGTVIPAGSGQAGMHEQLVVRRRGTFSAVVGLAAAVVAALYLWRAAENGGLLPWVVGGAMVLLAGYHLVEWIDARLPLLVADEIGIRLRIEDAWHGLVWSDVAAIDVVPRTGVRRDGFVAVRPVDADVLEGFGARRARLFAANQRRYGAPFVTVLGLTTVTGVDDLAAAVRDLADGRAPVRTPEPDSPAEPADLVEPSPADPPAEPADLVEPSPADPPAEPADLVEPSPADSPAEPADLVDTTRPDPSPPAHAPAPPPAPAPAPARALRLVRRALRAEVNWRPVPPIDGMLALDQRSAQPEPEADRAESDRRSRVRGNMSLVLPEPVDTGRAPSDVPEESALEAAGPAEPTPADLAVIGPQLAQARERLGLSIDELAARTRIRAHVLEAIEVDDFGPCGGDFYARGHLATLCRVLGLDPEPVRAEFEVRYAQAPVSPRKVFEAELATAGAIRGVGVGGPNWRALIAVVLLLLLVWGVASYFTSSQDPVSADIPGLTSRADAGVAAGAAGADGPPATAPVQRRAVVRLVAVGGDSRVVARAPDGTVVFRGVLLDGQTRWIRAEHSMRVRVADGGVVRARVNGSPRGFLGELGQPARIVVPAERADS